MRFKRLTIWLGLTLWLGMSVGHATVTVLNAEPSPNVMNNEASYEIAFVAPGAFPAGSYFEIYFPSDTIVPSLIPAGQITVNGVATTATASGYSQSLVVASPAAKLPVSNLVVARINTGAVSIVNPGQARSDYQVSVLTSGEPVWSSSPVYSITTSGSVLQAGSASVAPDLLASNGGYTIGFNTSADGVLRAEAGQVYLCFPGSTLVPSGALATTALLVNGTEVHAASGDGNTLSVTVDQWIYGSTAVTVNIPLALGIINPLTARADYRLLVSTSTQPVAGQSDAYTISSSLAPLSVGNVSVSPDCAGLSGAYTIAFDTSAGDMLGGESRVFICFPDTSVVPSGTLSASGVLVNGVQVSQVSGTGNTLTVTVAQDMIGDTSVVLELPASLGILNPSAAGSDYYLQVATSNQMLGGASNAFAITAPPTPTATPTATSTPTSTATSTITPTAEATMTGTITPTPSMTSIVTPDNPLGAIDLAGEPFLAFPNPAKEKVTFVLHTRQTADLKVVIYNLAGEQVAALRQQLGSGPGQSAVWDCRGAAPGVYIAHLLLDGKSIGKRKIAITR